jgi:hypothetical protein
MITKLKYWGVKESSLIKLNPSSMLELGFWKPLFLVSNKPDKHLLDILCSELWIREYNYKLQLAR